eukprot:scaffold8877_cov112-Isochrysis_galbana.AAC.6
MAAAGYCGTCARPAIESPRGKLPAAALPRVPSRRCREEQLRGISRSGVPKIDVAKRRRPSSCSMSNCS